LRWFNHRTRVKEREKEKGKNESNETIFGFSNSKIEKGASNSINKKKSARVGWTPDLN